MNISNLRIGLIHSLIGKNDGVSIVIDQTVHAMVNHMGISLGNIYFLAAHSSPRFNAQIDEIFWHKNELHTEIISTFCQKPAADLYERIEMEAVFAKNIISKWVEENSIDLIITHNTSHPYNFITAVALGYYFEELKEQDLIWPKIMVWWHDSYFERKVFEHPNDVMKKYLKYLPGTYVDAIAFINHQQIELGKKVFNKFAPHITKTFFKSRATVVPNTSSIECRCDSKNAKGFIAPEVERYNQSFWKDSGLLKELKKRGFTLDDAAILLQHTRIVPRKKIETALELAFRLDKKFKKMKQNRCIVLLVTGHSGDEQHYYKHWLIEHYDNMCKTNPKADVIFLMGENIILSHRDIIVDKKYYKFAELPSIVADQGGVGTYFSEVEGFGNNLLELISYGVPAVINKYEIFKTEIEKFCFKLPAVENCKITKQLVDDTYRLFTDIPYRNSVVKHNLKILKENLGHHIIAEKLNPVFQEMFTKKRPE
jgi:glycosyltransferase involved in cell wall biosynthesis